MSRGKGSYSGKKMAALATPNARAAIAQALRSWRSGTGTPFSPAMYGRRAAASTWARNSIRNEKKKR